MKENERKKIIANYQMVLLKKIMRSNDLIDTFRKWTIYLDRKYVRIILKSVSQVVL